MSWRAVQDVRIPPPPPEVSSVSTPRKDRPTLGAGSAVAGESIHRDLDSGAEHGFKRRGRGIRAASRTAHLPARSSSDHPCRTILLASGLFTCLSGV